MEQILYRYYANNAKELHRMVDRILAKFGGWSDKDKDDFYSLANEVFAGALGRYDGIQPFDGFLYVCLMNKIKSEITRRNREKRKADRMAVSLDTPVGNENGRTLDEFIVDSFDMEREIFGEISSLTIKLERYMKRLSRRQKTLLQLLSYCYKAVEIQKMLHLTQREYADELAVIRSYENMKILL